jgi:hypothetical protein
MKPSSSWAGNGQSAAQEFPEILWNLKVHNGVNKNPPLVPNPSQINPVDTSLSYFCKIHFNIVTCKGEYIRDVGFDDWIYYILYIQNSERQAIQRYCWCTRFKIHRYIGTSIIGFH